MTTERDPEALVARAAAEQPPDFAWGVATQRRTPKSSARWYANLIAAHRATGAA